MTDKTKKSDTAPEPVGPTVDAHNFVVHDPAKDGDVRQDPAWRKLVGIPDGE